MKISEFLEKYGDKEIDEEELKEELGIKKAWKPKKDEKYYCISGGQVEYTWYNDEFNISIGNCFKTRKEAEFMVERLKVIKELKDFALENNEEIDWNDVSQSQWYIEYGVRGCLETNYIRYYKHNDIYFTSEELCRLAIEKVGADRIKKYYLEVEE